MIEMIIWLNFIILFILAIWIFLSLKEEEKARKAILNIVSKLGQLIESDKTALQSSLKKMAHLINKLEGFSKKAIIQSKISEKYSDIALKTAHEAMIKVSAFEKSTHKIQMLPIDQVIKNNMIARVGAEKVMNPGHEDFDWFDIFEEESGGADELLGKIREQAKRLNSGQKD